MGKKKPFLEKKLRYQRKDYLNCVKIRISPKLGLYSLPFKVCWVIRCQIEFCTIYLFSFIWCLFQLFTFLYFACDAIMWSLENMVPLLLLCGNERYAKIKGSLNISNFSHFPQKNTHTCHFFFPLCSTSVTYIDHWPGL